MTKRYFIAAIGVLAWFVACGRAVAGSDGGGGDASVGGAGSSTSGTGGTPLGDGGATWIAGGGPSAAQGGAPLAFGGQGSGGTPNQAASGGTPIVSAGAAGDGPVCSGSYEECGCGCCGGTSQPASMACYYPEYGIELSDVIARDALVKSQPGCANAGCSLGKTYACCVTAPQEPAGTAQYTYEVVFDEPRLTLRKTEAGGMCATLVLSGLGEPLPTLSADLVNWVGIGSYAPCAEGAPRANAIGISGSVYAKDQTSRDGCSMNVHVTLFVASRDGEVQPVRFDVDGLALGSIMCPHRI